MLFNGDDIAKGKKKKGENLAGNSRAKESCPYCPHVLAELIFPTSCHLSDSSLLRGILLREHVFFPT